MNGMTKQWFLADLQDEVLRQSLHTATDEVALQAAWKQVPKSMRQVTSIVETYAQAAVRLDKPELAEPVIIASLQNEWNPALVLRYSDMNSGDNSKRLKQCEKWLKEHPEDAGLHLALGRLCAAESLWGKAREHMIPFPPSSPCMALFKDGELVHMLERHHIEGRPAELIAENLTNAYNEYC